MPQRRRRTYIVGYLQNSIVANKVDAIGDWVEFDGVLAQAFPFRVKEGTRSEFDIEGFIQEVSANFNKAKKESPFGDAGMMRNRHVYSLDANPVYEGTIQTLGNNLVDEDFVPEEFSFQMKNYLNGSMKKEPRK